MRHSYVRNPVRLFVSEVRKTKKASTVASSLETIADGDKFGPNWKKEFGSSKRSDNIFKKRTIESQLARWSKIDYVESSKLHQGYFSGLVDLMDQWMRNKTKDSDFTFRNEKYIKHLTKALKKELSSDTEERDSSLCTVWQLLRRSLRHEHRADNYVRVGGMVVYGIERGSEKPLLVLLIGKSGVLIGRGWIEMEINKFFIHVQESRREAKSEHQFLIFNIPDLDDRYVRGKLKTINGIFLAAVAGQAYRELGGYPIVATKCVATKMDKNSHEWLEERSWKIDDKFVSDFRNKFLCDYIKIDEAQSYDRILELNSLLEQQQKLPDALIVE